MIRASCFRSHLSPCQALAEALHQNSTLTDLDLRANYIGSETNKAGVSRGRGICSTWSPGPRSPKKPN